MHHDINPEVLEALSEEITQAVGNYGPLQSYHQMYGLLLEEVDELWDEIKRKPDSRSKERMYKEALQIGAIIIRFIHDLPEL